jgi:hypothetical protein
LIKKKNFACFTKRLCDFKSNDFKNTIFKNAIFKIALIEIALPNRPLEENSGKLRRLVYDEKN